MEYIKEITTNGKYYIHQIMILDGQPYEVGKITNKNPITGCRTKSKFNVPIKLYKNLGSAQKRYNKLISK